MHAVAMLINLKSVGTLIRYRPIHVYYELSLDVHNI